MKKKEDESIFEQIASDHFDDKDGNYKGVKGDHVLYRYEIQALLGTGSFGNVFKVYDHKEQKDCALKML